MKTNRVTGFLSIFSARGASLIIRILSVPIIIRFLGDSNYGTYAFLMSVIAISMILVNAGINDGIRKFVAEARYPSWGDYVLGYYLRVGFLFAATVCCAFIGLNLIGITAQYFERGFVTYFYLISLVIVGRQFLQIFQNAIMAKGLEYISEPLRVLNQVLFVIVAITLISQGFGVTGALLGHVLAAFITTSASLYLIRKYYNFQSVLNRIPKDFPRKKLSSFNLYNIIFILLTASLYHTDILLLQPLAGSQATGYYKAALVIAELLWFLPQVFQSLLVHSSSEIWYNQNDSEVTEFATRITRYTLISTLLLVIGIAALSDPFVPYYYGGNFNESIGPLLILLPGALSFALARPILSISQGKGNLKPLIAATGFASLVNVLLNLALIPRWGIYGAGMATSVGYGLMLFTHVRVARSIGFYPFSDLRLFKILIAATPTAVIIFSLRVLIGDGLLSLLIIPPTGFVTYLICITQSGALSQNEFGDIISECPKPIRERIIQIQDWIYR